MSMTEFSRSVAPRVGCDTRRVPEGDATVTREPSNRPESGEHERRLAINTIAQQASQVIVLVTALVAITVVARRLSLPEFGTYGLLVSLTAYVSFVQGSIEAAAVKSVAEAADQRARDEAFSTALSLYVVAGVAAGAILAIGGTALLGVFNIPARLQHEAQQSVVGLGVGGDRRFARGRRIAHRSGYQRRAALASRVGGGLSAVVHRDRLRSDRALEKAPLSLPPQRSDVGSSPSLRTHLLLPLARRSLRACHLLDGPGDPCRVPFAGHRRALRRPGARSQPRPAGPRDAYHSGPPCGNRVPRRERHGARARALIARYAVHPGRRDSGGARVHDSCPADSPRLARSRIRGWGDGDDAPRRVLAHQREHGSCCDDAAGRRPCSLARRLFGRRRRCQPLPVAGVDAGLRSEWRRARHDHLVSSRLSVFRREDALDVSRQACGACTRGVASRLRHRSRHRRRPRRSSCDSAFRQPCAGRRRRTTHDFPLLGNLLLCLASTG